MRHFLILFLFFPSLFYCQNDFSKTSFPEDKYKAYFDTPRETIHLQLNKTSFLKGEEIWFTAYIYNRKKQLPYTKTRNLYCALYDASRNKLSEELFLVKNGIATGNISIGEDIKDDKIYIVASTNYQQNFDDTKPFIQELTIVSNNRLNQSSAAQEFDLQLLPESGHLLTNTTNSVGFILTDNRGKGHKIIDGKVINSDNNLVASSLKSNDFGIGKFNIFIQPDKTYTLILTDQQGNLIKKQLPDSKQLGVILSLNNLLEDKVAIAIKSNKQTISKLPSNQLYLAIHRDGLFAIKDFNLTQTTKTLFFSRSDLHPGINIITLFDYQFNPIAERIIFNNKELKEGEVLSSIAQNYFSKDSVRIQFKVLDPVAKTNLSISFLPSQTEAYKPNNSILSSFWLQPYLKNGLNDLTHYLTNMDRKKGYELDNLLITKGWSSYDWNNIFESTQKENYEFEDGIAFSGKVINAKKRKNKLVLLNPASRAQYYAEVDSTRHFQIKNAYSFRGDSLRGFIFTKRGNYSKPYFSIDSIKKGEGHLISEQYFASIKESEENSMFNNKELGSLIELSNVDLFGKRKKFYVYGGSTSAKIVDEYYGSLSNYIRRLGYLVSPTNPLSGELDGYLYAYKIVLGEIKIVPVITSNSDGAGFFDIPLRNINSIGYNHLGEGKFIYVNEKKNKYQLFADIVLKDGFKKPDQYYNPRYNSFNTDAFKTYGALHWEGQLTVDEEGTSYIDIPNFNQKNIKVFLEGISSNGTLFSQEQELTIH
ncbi:hypothetical protein ABN763_14780 [Spongiivirga sp. MCCC 1A20706]|uniref:hypothetical protein n=1 Tax=Spongiivirga sp. MCCC 1A20706 TaxID=3160963 RepID=UPI0039775375